jgi:hypothetical protein
MAQKLIPWNTGGGNIVVNYSGSGNDTVTVGSDTDNTSPTARSQVITLTTIAGGTVSKTVTITQEGKPSQAVWNFDYTGAVQSVELPAGTYKLQVWGAQGGDVTGDITAAGSKGGYSEGIVTFASPTTVYVFVGGKGADVATTTTSGTSNGGWNGGGGSINFYGTTRPCYPRGGGGGTDIATVSSTMNYANYRTNRSAESLNSRLIVAGGGAGASARRGTSSSNPTVSNGNQVGGGDSGGGTYPGTQLAPGYQGDGGLGYGSNQLNQVSNLSGAGGGGRYGGGSYYSSFSNSAVNSSGGGSGYIGGVSNGTTISGNQSFEAPDGTTETGHAGNGYARITQVS